MFFKRVTLGSFATMYQHGIKPLLFLEKPDTVHTKTVLLGEKLGQNPYAKTWIGNLCKIENPILQQKISGIDFKNPIGLSAGFDYEGRLTQILPSLGFGFETIGTITHHAYNGNPAPMLGRLPKSQSLMVNKGFKNLGAWATIERLNNLHFSFPVGISIGRSNIKQCNTQAKSIDDILDSFVLFEKSAVQHAYYELNISCPNLFGDITFYPPKNLEDLLKEVNTLKIKKPIFIKMPIERSDEEVKKMLAVIARFSPKGVIFGNLQKNRSDKTFYQNEINKFPIGNFSGKPTYQRSNDLIKLCYQQYKKRFVIIGCGGVFTAQDAYEKISLGASLIQLITGMIFNGPQLISQINLDLIDVLRHDGYTNIRQAIGRKVLS